MTPEDALATWSDLMRGFNERPEMRRNLDRLDLWQVEGLLTIRRALDLMAEADWGQPRLTIDIDFIIIPGAASTAADVRFSCSLPAFRHRTSRPERDPGGWVRKRQAERGRGRGQGRVMVKTLPAPCPNTSGKYIISPRGGSTLNSPAMLARSW